MRLQNDFQHITNHTFDAITSIDESGNILTWNLACEKLFGYGYHEVIEKNLHSLIMPPEYKDRFEAGFKEFCKTGDGYIIGKEVEMEALCKDGHRILIELSVSAVKNNEKWNAIGIIRDITEKRRLESEKKTQELLLIQQSKMASMGEMLGAILHQWRQPLNTNLF